MRFKPAIILIAVVLASALPSRPLAAQEELYLELTQPGLRRIALAAPPFMVLPGTPAELSTEFQHVLGDDLAAAAPVVVVEPRLYALVEPDPRPEVTNQRWRSIGAQFLLSGSIVRAGGQVVVEARMVDLVSGEVALSKRYRAGVSAVKVVAHSLANDVVKAFTGRPGPFLSRIAFVSDRSGSSELWVMDWDGSNATQLTKHGSIAIGPAWSPDGQRIAFTSFLRGGPAVFLLTPAEGYLRMLWDRGGVNSSPTFSPDSRQIAFASSVDGNVDIWVIPSEGGVAVRLTTARAIDTQPAWAPNGRQIAFTSARAGTPQIYLMDADGSNVRRLTFTGEFHDEAAWALDGTRIVCTTREGGRFQLATLDTVTGDERVIPGPGNNEGPCFSPDGSMLAFASDRSGTQQIYITDAEGRPRQLTSEGRNHSPAWTALPSAK